MNRAVLVTGGSRGIGAAVARAFAERGDRVAVHCGRDVAAAQAVLDSLPGQGHVVVQADLADAAAVKAMVDEAAGRLGGLDVLVNNAGIYVDHPVLAASYEEWQAAWQATLGVNLVGAANVTWCAVRHMTGSGTERAAAGGGRIVNVGSRGAYRGEPTHPAYGAAKAGLHAFGQSLAVALAPQGITVASVAPGYVLTDMTAEELATPAGDAIRAQSPFNRVATPEEIAAAVVYLASPGAAWSSGAVLDLNGASYLRLTKDSPERLAASRGRSHCDAWCGESRGVAVSPNMRGKAGEPGRRAKSTPGQPEREPLTQLRAPIAKIVISGNVATVTDDGVIPPFDSLPRLPGTGVQHSWDVWGPGDNFGTLNRLTETVVAAATGCVRTGERIGVSLPLGLPDPAFFGRKAFRHTFVPLGPAGWDDYLDGFYLQCSSQWDGLRHIGSPDGWYGGWSAKPGDDLEPLGMHHWAARGIVGRGVLVDLAARARAADPGYDPFARVVFRPDDLAAALAAQGTELRGGDILCVRTGWAERYLSLSPAERVALAEGMKDVAGYASAGLAGSEEMARFLWDSGVAALPCDNPAVEVVPSDPADGFLHGRLIPGLGMAIGELFTFSELAAACARQGRYEFLFVSVPLNVTGAIGSPANAVAIF